MHDEAHMESVMHDSQINCTKHAHIERDLLPSVETQWVMPTIVSNSVTIPNTPNELDISPSVANQFIAPTAPPIRALVLRAPGINCDRETAQACRLAGFETDLVHINQLIKAPNNL